MAHQFDSGMIVGNPAWHGLGNLFTKESAPRDKVAMMEAAGMNWTVLTGIPCAMVQNGVDEKGHPKYDFFSDDEERKALVRSDTGKILSFRGENYQVVQHEYLFEKAELILKADPNIHLETAISLKGGKIPCLLFNLGESDMVTAQDMVKPYLVMYHSYDGSQAFHIGATITRVVCMNTLSASQMDEVALKFTHSSSIFEKIDTAVQFLLSMKEGFGKTMELYRKLLNVTISEGDVKKLFIRFLQVDPEEFVRKEMVSSADRTMTKLQNSYLNAPGASPGNLWGVYNGVTHYLTHKGRLPENRFVNNLMGISANQNADFLSLLAREAGLAA